MNQNYSIFKKKYFWATSFVLLYFIITIFIIPYVIKSQSVSFINNNLNHKANIERVTFNPFIFELWIYNFQLHDKNDDLLINFEKLRVDFNLARTVYKQIITFDAINMYKPKINIKLYKDGTINLLKLLPKQEKIEEENVTKDVSNEMKILPINLSELKIEKTEIIVTDYALEKPFTVNIHPKDYTIFNLSTVLDEKGTYSYNIVLNEHSKIKGSGVISLNPINITGDIFLEKLHLGDFWPRVENNFKFYINDSIFDFNAKYNFSYINNKISLNVFDTNAQLTDFKLGSKSTKKDLIKLNSFMLNEFSLSLPQQEIIIDNITLNSLYTDLVIHKDFKINIAQLFQKEEKNTINDNSKKEKNDEEIWNLSIRNIDLKNSKVDIEDKSINKPFSTSINNINLNLKNIDLKENTKVQYEFNSIIHSKANFESNGNISINPLAVKSDYNLKNLPLKMFQSYLDETLNLNIKNGNFNTKGNFILNPKTNKFSVEANSIIKNIDIKHNNSNESLIKFSNIAINKLNFTQEKNSLKIKSIDLIQPYVKVFIDKNKTTNFDSIVKKSNEKENKKEKIKVIEKENEIKDKEFIFDLGPINIKKGSMNFTDLSLPLPFKSYIESLEGDISKLSSYSTKPSDINIKGIIDKYGFAQIKGSLDYKNIKEHSKVNMLFKNISIKNLSPYSIEFIGREINDGKLTLDLEYNISQSKLNAINKIVVDKIVLGKELNSEKSIPIDLAIALLEDSNGIIDISLPIEGNVDSPDFKIGSIVGHAFVNLIVKVVTSPFSFLGSLLGIEGDDLKFVEYEAGEYTLLPPAKEKIDLLANAFKTRPNLALEVNKIYHIQKDTQAIKVKKFNTKLEVLLADLNKKFKEKDTYIIALENMYIKNKTKDELEKLKESYWEVKDDKKTFKKSQYANHLKDSQIIIESVTNKELEDLAQNRVNAFIDYVVKKQNAPRNRVVVKDLIILDDNQESKWVKSEFGITVKQK